jgi:thymidylate synthase (FAD)
MSKIEVLDHGYVRLVDTLGDDLSVVNAARVSYDKESTEFTPKDEKLIGFLLREGHTSPFRHAALTFVSSTHVDDQNGWNESSRRYITESEEFYVPSASAWRSKPENSKQGSGEPIHFSNGAHYTNKLRESIVDGVKLYHEAMEDNVAPELARLFLPAYGMYVRWRWTTSLQGVITFLEQRLGHDAQVEIQDYAKAVEALTKEAFPHTMDASVIF